MTDFLADDLPPVHTVESPAVADLHSPSIGMGTGGVGDCEGTRADVVGVMQEEVAVGASGQASARGGRRGSPIMEREFPLLFLEDKPGVHICGCILTPGGGLAVPKFCAEKAEDGLDRCSRITHGAKEKVEVKHPTWFITVPSKGRGGLAALTDSELREEEVPGDKRAVLDSKEKTPSEWTAFFGKLRIVHRLAGRGLDAHRFESQNFEQALKGAVTPQKSPLTLPHRANDSPQNSDDGWMAAACDSSIFPDVIGVACDALKPGAHGKVSASKVSEAISTVECNACAINDCLRVNQEAMTLSFHNVTTKVNDLVGVNATLALSIGEPRGFGREFGVTSAFDGLRHISEVLTDKIDKGAELFRKAPCEMIVGRVNTLRDDVTSIQSIITSGDQAKAERVKAELDHLRESMEKTVTGLKTRYLVPLIEANAKLMDPRNAVLDRLEELERNCTRLNADSNLCNGTSFGGAFAGGTGCEMGGSTQIAKLNRRLSELEMANSQLKTQVDELEGRETARPSAPDHDDGLVRSLMERVNQLETADQEGITIGVETFNNINDVEEFLRTKVPPNVLAAHAFDWVSLIHMTGIDDGKTSVESLLARDHHANKGGFEHIGSAIICSSMQQAVPGPFMGGVADTGLFPLPGVKKFDVFDKLDGKTGKRNLIAVAADRKVSSMMKMLTRECRAHPNAVSVFGSMLAEANSHWKHLGQNVSDTRNVSYQQCGDVEEAWTCTCERTRGAMDECHKRRLGGAERSSAKAHTLQDAARMMWGALRTHQIMNEFVECDFQGHPRLASCSLSHLFRHRASPKDLAALQTKVTALSKAHDATQSLAERLKKKHGV